MAKYEQLKNGAHVSDEAGPNGVTTTIQIYTKRIKLTNIEAHPIAT